MASPSKLPTTVEKFAYQNISTPHHLYECDPFNKLYECDVSTHPVTPITTEVKERSFRAVQGKIKREQENKRFLQEKIDRASAFPLVVDKLTTNTTIPKHEREILIVFFTTYHTYPRAFPLKDKIECAMKTVNEHPLRGLEKLTTVFEKHHPLIIEYFQTLQETEHTPLETQLTTDLTNPKRPHEYVLSYATELDKKPL